ncbi:hypothetical protein COW36_21800 [bacterium (Candidatus Blackallbacteria) CG17_big_fil_post_rev_8_21_14_2_50_48_46]|uniref:Uncharacterized protein n=1 Tax=bacterium (Candidatus Blackallbacteria) CG17_big_fil_post_rev_8_21_14_2_50_48_46 TaxID=2014261 RepID=A0A2M7FYX3_9BACT|nr:MAG: hypothetical protein COW64_11060 [bacterium (Candidatus Blackallbacteria) CG18_big_fil_WC_8_21_14_2_50_49_26]PIW14404.1 MAG: hypothetical protein COW36_21800 [bacterium (Candidatus Blackallbacteria) CG17_big_fil_post_rev_8_21_14_2_50_48_46]PIW46911.1 MAG: hypothetical protein COW20_14215 [bacterium (Candidatus Blackallbacteria) CG13_big_fil_rev_8_21_14_2_50_49_14]
MLPNINRSPEPLQNQIWPPNPTAMPAKESLVNQSLDLQLPQDQVSLQWPQSLESPNKIDTEEMNIQFFEPEDLQTEAKEQALEESKLKAKQSLLKDEKSLHQAQDKFSQIQSKYLLSFRRYEQAQDLLSDYQSQIHPGKNAPSELKQKINTLKFEVQRLHAETEQGRWALEQQNTVVDKLQLQVERSRSHYLLLNQEN